MDLEAVTIKTPYTMQNQTIGEFVLAFLETSKRLYGANTSIEKLQQILRDQGLDKIQQRMGLMDLVEALRPEEPKK